MHIPKSAGTAFRLGLQGLLRPAAMLDGFDGSMFGGFGDFASMENSVRQHIHVSDAGIPGEAQLVAGHFAYSSLRRAYDSGQFMTLLREPVCRLLSLWLFWRQHDDAMLAPWGGWGDHVRLSRDPLAKFLDEPAIACQTDNMVARMLLWPHPLIPADGFIDPAHDKILLRQARRRLSGFAFADAIESPHLRARLHRWFGRGITSGRVNELSAIPRALRRPLESELTPEAAELLRTRSRLDLELWQELMRASMPEREILQLREDIRIRNVARYGALMNPAAG